MFTNTSRPDGLPGTVDQAQPSPATRPKAAQQPAHPMPVFSQQTQAQLQGRALQPGLPGQPMQTPSPLMQQQMQGLGASQQAQPATQQGMQSLLQPGRLNLNQGQLTPNLPVLGQPQQPSPSPTPAPTLPGQPQQPAPTQPAPGQPAPQQPGPTQPNQGDGGGYRWVDPYTGQEYHVPVIESRVELSPEEQRIFDANQRARQNLADMSDERTQFLRQYLSQNPNYGEGLPGIQYGVQGGPVINQSVNAGPVQRDVQGQTFDARAAQGGRIQDQIGDAGQIQRGVQGQSLINRDAQGGDITRSYGANDFSQDRQRVEDALMERMNPQIERDRAAMEARLANQGIGMGARAYSAAQNDFGQNVNDARLGAILSAGQEQSRMVGMDRDRATFQNQAQGQAFGQDLSNIQQRNQAMGQQFSQDMAQGQFANQAQQQQFGQQATRAQFGNEAQQQRFQQDFQNIGQQNNARGMQLQSDLARAQFGNQAQNQVFGQNLTDIQQRNQAQQQQFQQSLTNAQMNNAGRAQGLQEQFMQRNAPLQELGMLLGGGQPMMPNFNVQQPQGMPYTDNAGLINNHYNQQMQQYNAQMGAWQNTMGGLLGGLGGIISDARLKTDVRRVGSTDAGVPIYTYRYVWGGPVQMGVMAQELGETQPEAVVAAGDFLAVDYGKVQ